MSDLVFPASLSGYTWDSKKKPVFNNLTHSPATGRDVRIALYSQPVYEFSLNNAWLTADDKATLMGFFLARRGSFDSFLYSDEDSVATNELFGNGDGVTTAFQLLKWLGSANQIVNNLAGLPLIYKNNVLQVNGTHYAINPTGLISFVTAPAIGDVLRWTGSAYYRCIFMEDSQEYNQFASKLYECNEISFKGAMVNKL